MRGRCHQGSPTPLPRWSSLCPSWLRADPVGRARQGQAGAARDAPQLGLPPALQHVKLFVLWELFVPRAASLHP